MYIQDLIDDMFSMCSHWSGLFDLISENAHAFVYRLFVSDGNFSYSIDTFFDKLRIDFVQVFLNFFEDGFIVFAVNNSD